MSQPRTASSRWTPILLWLLLGGFLYLFGQDFYLNGILMDNPPSLASKRFVAFWAISFVLVATWLFWLIMLIMGRRLAPLSRLFDRIAGWMLNVPAWMRTLFAVAFTLTPALLVLFTPPGFMRLHFWARFGMLLLSGFLASLFALPRSSLPARLVSIAAFTGLAGAIFAAGGWLNQVTSYPFSLGWSDGNRLWDYSILFASDRYNNPSGEPIFAFISRGRSFLWAVAYLIPGIGIWGVRLWDALVWIVPPLLLGFSLFAGASETRGCSRGLRWLLTTAFAIWCMAFISQGPIYAPLTLAAIPVVLGVRTRRLGWIIPGVILATYYAQISRWTWMYAPGLWAALILFLQVDNPRLHKSHWRALLPPVIAGLVGLLTAQFSPTVENWIKNGLDGGVVQNIAATVASSVTRQPLLWDRLLPNITYPPGLLLGTIWAAAPLLILLSWLLIRRIWRINALQMLAAGGISLIFLIVGMIASTKIGGGSNLHNLDMFWITLVILAGFGFRALIPHLSEIFNPAPNTSHLIPALLISLALLGPASYAVLDGHPMQLPSKVAWQAALDDIARRVGAADAAGQQVLFIDQRQLLTFGDVPNVPLIDDYEKKYLMDQAMTGDQAYFDQFYADLASQRFGLIISEPLWIKVQGDDENFGDENNAWVKWVSGPVLCYYEPVVNHPVGVQLLEPRDTVTPPDPSVTCP